MIKKKNIYYIIILLVVMLSFNYYHENLYLYRYLGKISIFSFLFIAVLSIRYIKKNAVSLYFIASIIILMQLVNYYKTEIIKLTPLIQLVFIILCINLSSKITIRKNKNIYLLFLFLFIFITVQIYISENIYSISYNAFFSNPNALGIFTISIMPLWNMTSPKKSSTILLYLICFVIILLSNSRTALLAYITYIICITSSKYWSTSKKRTLSIFIALNILSILIVTYILSIDNNFYIAGKPVLSGRDTLWPTAIRLIEEKLWFGWGTGHSLIDLTTLIQNTHNQYLNLLLQYGIFGLFLFMLLLYSIVFHFTPSNNSVQKRIVLSTIASALVLMNFEDAIFQSSLWITMPFWCLIGIAYGEKR